MDLQQKKCQKTQTKPSLPGFVTPDIDALIVFRTGGDNRLFLGLRREIVFQIVCIAEHFGGVYKDKP